MRDAVVTGITSRDGNYSAQLLIEKEHKVFGSYQRAASTNFW
jgi:GDPmannose 4,6-dehydratase